jgi:peptidyl-dipeptidase A
MKFEFWMVCGMVLWLVSGCGMNPSERRVQRFIDLQVKTVSPLLKESGLAYWSAATTGDSAEYRKYMQADLKVRQTYGNPFEYKQLGEWKASGKITNPILARQLDVLLNAFLPNQVESDLLRQIVTLAAGAEERFSTFRGTIDGKEMSANGLAGILKTSADVKLREKAYASSPRNRTAA